MLNPTDKQWLIQNYRELFGKYGGAPEGTQMSYEGRLMRFEQLTKVGNMSNCKVLDIGCATGDFLPVLKEHFNNIQYLGIDLVPEIVQHASEKYPDAKFECRDIFEEPLKENFDYILISSLFNNAIPNNSTDYLKLVVAEAFKHCTKALAFNFISNRVNVVHEVMAYHDPVEVFRFCIDKLSNKVTMDHHYQRCDVSVFVYR
jgi:trans-aconitate methyltransferase